MMTGICFRRLWPKRGDEPNSMTWLVTGDRCCVHESLLQSILLFTFGNFHNKMFKKILLSLISSRVLGAYEVRRKVDWDLQMLSGESPGSSLGWAVALCLLPEPALSLQCMSILSRTLSCSAPKSWGLCTGMGRRRRGHTLAACKLPLVCVLFATLWAVACQAPPFMGFPWQEYRSGLPFPHPGDLPDPGLNPCLLLWQMDSFITAPPGKPKLLLTLQCKKKVLF